MSDTKVSVTSVTVSHQFGEIIADEVCDSDTPGRFGDLGGFTNMRVYVTRAVAAKAIMAEENGNVFGLLDSRGMIYEVWSE